MEARTRVVGTCDIDCSSQLRRPGILVGVIGSNGANEANEGRDDAALVTRLRAGDRTAFDAIYARFHVRIYGFLFRLSGRRDVADDLFQETWTKLATHADRLRDDSDLAAWLFTVARNAHRNHRRWTMLDLGRLAAGNDPHAFLESVAEHAPGPAVRAEDAQQLARLERALARLSAASREALLLVAVEGFEQEQAAAIVGASYPAFRQRLSRARAELSVALERNAGGSSP